jgi:hypothetical protein
MSFGSGIVPNGALAQGSKRVPAYRSDEQTRMEVNATPERAWVLEDHHHVTIAKSVNVARERRSVFPDVVQAGKVYRLRVVGRLQLCHGYLLGLIEITPSSAT